MKISVFGLGYVGTVSAACLADMGHEIVGVDVARHKIDMINSGQPPVTEPKLAGLVERAVNTGKLHATMDAWDAVIQTDVSFICVGTPSLSNGGVDLEHLQEVCGKIGTALADKDEFHVVVVRSTILPGTIRHLVIPLLERRSGKRAGKDFGVCNNPEFMREGNAVDDFFNPPKIVIGTTDFRSRNIIQGLYSGLPGKHIRCNIETGEMVKYVDNAWHATKVAFANEIGRLCKSSGIDSHKVMEIFCSDTKLNISSSYLKPGFAFGGSCLPKDVRALTYQAQFTGIETPLIDALLASNDNHIRFGLEMILACKKKSIGFLGISFKAGTDDLRESPLVDLVRQLAAKGFNILIYDCNIHPARLSSSNREYIKGIIPHIDRMIVNDMDKLLRRSEIIVIGNNTAEFSTIAAELRPEQTVIDLVRIREIEDIHTNYHGIGW